MVEQHAGDIARPFLPSLLRDQGIEAPYGIRFQPVHGSAPVDDEYELRDIVFHDHILRSKKFMAAGSSCPTAL
jgi:hypothetical protein